MIAELELAKADLASGAFAEAWSRAEAVLRASGPPDVRATALIVAGDAAYGMRAYKMAAQRYRKLLSKHRGAPEASHAALALGWAELRLGHREKARRAWTQLARQYPEDPRVPVALVLAAQVSSQAGDAAAARKLLDRVVESHAGSPEAGLGRLSRSILSVRDGRIQEAARDLRVLVQSSRSSVAQERQRFLDGLLTAGAEAGLERELVLTNASRGDEDGQVPAAGARPFERFAAPFLDSARDPEVTLLVLHGLIRTAAEDKAWPDVQGLSNQLVDRFPAYQAAPGLLAWVAERAFSDRQWPIVRVIHEQMIARYPNARSPKARVDFAEALFRMGAVTEARTELTRFVDAAPRALEAPRALVLVAEANEVLDQPREALAAYERLRRDYPHAEWTAESLLPHARLLQHAIGREKDARLLLEEAVQRTEGEALGEASFRLARILTAEGEHGRAVDWYMSAAYAVTEDSRWYRPALLGAGRSLQTLNRMQEALIVYRKVLPSTPVGRLAEDGGSRPAPADLVADPEPAGEAAYRTAEILFGTGRSEDALDMYLTAAYLVPDSPWGRRALVGAVRSLVTTGDRASAGAIYRRLLSSSATEPELLAEARKALRPVGGTSQRGR
ncbi:MAG: tetratricopeptide repeat protein [Candidatus Rokuibacteriota bacterium]